MKAKRLILMLLVMMTTAIGWADDEAVIDGIKYRLDSEKMEAAVMFYNLFDDEEYSINGYEGDLIVPESVVYNEQSYTVTAVDDYALGWCMDLSSITLPATIKKLGKSFFKGSWNIKKLICSAIDPPTLGGWDSEAAGDYDDDDTEIEVLYVPASSVSKYVNQWEGLYVHFRRIVFN